MSEQIDLTSRPANPTSAGAPEEAGAAMERVLVWDLPVRIFHWLFALSFLSSFTIAQVVDDDSTAFAAHMLLGGVMAFLVLLRIVWGFVGTRHARFRAFAFGPAALASYLKAAVSGDGGERHPGHNPGSSVAIYLMLALAAGLAVSGAFMARGGEVLEEVHEVLAYSMLAVVGVHLAGVAWHTIRHRENITLGMLDGRKQVDRAEGIASARPFAAAGLIVLTGLWGWGLYAGYDPATQQVRLPLVGVSLALGEGEDEHHDERDEHRDHDDHHDDDDD